MKTAYNNTLEYKGYNGTIEVSLADNCLFGRVIGIQGSITYEGTTLDELKEDFKNGIEDYLQYCTDKNIDPQKPFTGMFNVRLNSDLHKRAVIRAKNKGQSLNSFVKEAIEHELQQ